MPSPKSAYPQHGPPAPLYPHHAEVGPQGASENGPPPPPIAEGPPSRPDDRPASVGPKRMREWEEEPAIKKQANDETRARLEEMRPRRLSTPPRESYRRNSSEARRVEEQRRAEEPRRPDEPRHANDAYHPSEAAHHPQSHSIVGPNPMQGVVHDKSTPVATPKEDRPAELAAAPRAAAPTTEPERAARKMEVDEDYDDSGEDEKKALANGSGPGSASGEMKTSTPTSAGVNGASGPTPKVE